MMNSSHSPHDPSAQGDGEGRQTERQAPHEAVEHTHDHPVEAEEPPVSRNRLMVLGANDGTVDDFLDLVDSWQMLTGQNLMDPVEVPVPESTGQDEGEHRDALARIARDFSPRQMRELGASLLKLADAIDQDWHPTKVRSSYHWITRAGWIERHSLELAQVAIRSREAARRRARFISHEFFGEPAWEMLLELFIQFSGKADVSTKSLCLVSGVSDTSSLRILDRLDDACLIERSQSPNDKRVTLVKLTRQGVVAVGSILAEQAA